MDVLWMFKGVGRLLGFCLVLSVYPSMVAAISSDVAGSADLPGVERYPLSYIVDYQRLVAPEYRLALGSMQKVNGVVSPERVEAIRGGLTRVTYQIPAGHGSGEAFSFIRRQLTALPGDVLFECSGRDCGSSSQWANAQFEISKLYGVDREQYYLAYRLRESQAHVAVYAVKRGNKRVYLHIDHIAGQARSEAGDRLAITEALREHSRLYVLASDPQGMDKVAQAAGQLLAEDLSRQLLLVGHSALGLTTEQRIDHSRQSAEKVRQRLIELGVEASRVVVFGVGSLAPAYDAKVDSERVELLLQ